jgi:hypothetical protein
LNFTDVLSQAVRTLLRDGQHPPTVLVDFEGLPAPVRRTFALPAPGAQREQTMLLQGRRLAESYGDRVVQRIWFISECWMNSFALGSRPPLVNPTRDPGRREVLFVIELDATSPELLQRGEIQEMRRNRRKKLTGLVPVREFAGESGPVTAQGVLVLSFLEGFSEKASSHPGIYGPLRAKIRLERIKIAIKYGDTSPL